MSTKPADPPVPHADNDPQLAAQSARIGLWLFGVYSTLYLGFVLLAAFAPRIMRQTPFGGVNFAIIYGFGLIFGALVMALLYTFLCRQAAAAHAAKGGGR